jgi:hypothetical protein
MANPVMDTPRKLRPVERPQPEDETTRLAEDAARARNWKRWGTYLAERQWGTVREDYSEGGSCWEYFPHDHARSRAYRWGEDGLLGWTDRENRMCFALAVWNGKDPILKERLFGLTGPEGNHGEDVKECYFYLDSTPTCSYAKGLYRYPQAEYPYAPLVEENRRRGRQDREYELSDTGVLDGGRYFDVIVEYAKASPEDTLVQVTIANRGAEPSTLHVLPTLWLRNTWAWGRTGEGYWPKGRIAASDPHAIVAEHPSLGRYRLSVETQPAAWLFTENETNTERVFATPNATPYVKDAFHEYVVHGRTGAVNPAGTGTKAAALYRVDVPAGGETLLRLRLTAESETGEPFGARFEQTLAARRREADEFFAARVVPGMTDEERNVSRQAYAALLWSRQFFHYDVRTWLEGDPAQPPPPAARKHGRNADWVHLYNRDVLSIPEKWEYPWYAAWDLAFHMLPMAEIDPEFAKSQLVLFLREWYMHPNGQIPAYEFAFGDVNPPVHAWAAWRVYKMTGQRGARDHFFLARVFQKLLLNFTWWVNRKDSEGNHIFGGGFLGMDNIGVFDRSQPLPTGGTLEQADGTAWMGFYCSTLLSMALELATKERAYEDMASKLFEHFIRIADAVNVLGGSGLWSEQDGFYYDQLNCSGKIVPMRIRSMVGLLPLIAVEVIEEETLAGATGFRKRMEWFLENRPELADYVTIMREKTASDGRRLLALPTKERLVRVLGYMLDENEFFSPYGIRSVSRYHHDHPYVLAAGGREYAVDYEPGESTTGIFGGNSNWRGPVWFPLNYLLLEALQRYHHFYGDGLKVECPTGSGRFLHLGEVSRELARRLSSTFLPGADGRRPYDDSRVATDPRWRDYVRFHEYFDGDTGRGLGARFQGWTLLVTRCLEDVARGRRP